MLGLGECKGGYGVNWERYGEYIMGCIKYI